jgi:iron-sulfur cluster repair protein YtfE (RIC family)
MVMTHACHCGCRSVRAEQTVGEIMAQDAGALEALKEKGINHCCGAHLTLSEAAAAAGVPLAALLTALREARNART